MGKVITIQKISGLNKYIKTTDTQLVASNGGVAFFAYLSTQEPNPGTHKTFIFDVDTQTSGVTTVIIQVYLPVPAMAFMSFLGAYTVM